MKLSKRLETIASFVPKGSKIADIGTDHGYIPIYLVENGAAVRALAMDVREGPLARAREHVEEHGLSDRIETRLSDGMEKLRSGEADTVIIAGMGGELILRIISEAPWLCAMDKHLVLQPMTTAMQLREGLAALGFTIDREEAVVDSDKIYSVMSVYYTDQKRDNLKLIDLYMGQIKPGSPFSARYAKSVRHNIENKIKGMRHGGADSSALEILLQMLLDLYGEEENA